MNQREKLEYEIYGLSRIIKRNALALENKPLNDYDREALQRHMAARMTQLARLQMRLNHLGPWNP
jgi:hypothetical protein